MSAPTHTPGPWHIGVRQPTSDKFIYGPQGSEVANCDRRTNFPAVELANARLIAAAPDLLSLLHRVLVYEQRLIASKTDGGIALVSDIRSTLAKAEGQA